MYIEKMDSLLYLRIAEPVGFRRPLIVGASRKAILAFLPPREVEGILRAARSADGPALRRLRTELARIRREGYAVGRGETTPGTTGIAAPLFDARGVAVGAISVSAPDQRFPEARILDVAVPVPEAARAISRTLGYVGPARADDPRSLRGWEVRSSGRAELARRGR